MIARIRGFRDHIEYVALHIDDARDVWVTIRGDRGASGEQSALAAVRLCVDDLREQLAPTIEQAAKLAKLCDRLGRPRTLDDRRQMRDLSSVLARTLAVAGRNLERLLDQPTEADDVHIAGEFEPIKPP